MKPTKTLPASYVHYATLEPPKYKKAHWLALLIALPLAPGIYTLLNKLADMLRADYTYGQAWNPRFNFWIAGSLIFVIVITIALHELIHGLVLWLFTHERPEIRIVWPGIGIEITEWYIPRNIFLAAALAPLILLTLIGLMLLFAVPHNLIGTIALAATINIVGSYQDIAVAIYAFLLPESALINPAHKHATIYVRERLPVENGQDDEPKWQTRSRTFLEQKILSRLR